MPVILYTGLQEPSLEQLRKHLPLPDVMFEEVAAGDFKEVCKALPGYQALLIGEEVENPVRFAQEAYSHDKSISVLLFSEPATYTKIKQSVQFSPFIGPTVQCLANNNGLHMAHVLEDALQRTAQRRSFSKLKKATATEHKFAPKALEKVKTDFTTKVLEEAPIGAVLISGSGIVFSINNYALGLFSRSEKDVLGTSFATLFPGVLEEEVRSFVQGFYPGQPKKQVELKLQETIKYLELSVSPIDMQSASNYKLVILQDVTAAVQAQQRTLKHLEDMEKVNANLARVNADLDTFVYTASHDLKSPILNIEGLVTSLEEELGPNRDMVALELEHIKRSINRFKLTVEELTEVARVQKSSTPDATTINVAELLDDVKHLLEREIKDTGALITLQQNDTPILNFSKRNLTSILYNLVNNGIKYRSPSRVPHIDVKTWREGQDVFISVSDNGLGIPADYKERVFQLFKRMHTHVQGSGVGLYIVKRIVENNGGNITVESQEGSGSVFTLQLKEQLAAVQL